MELVEVQFSAKRKPYNKVKPLVEKFLAAGFEVMELVGWEENYGDYKRAYNSIFMTIKQNKKFSNAVRVTCWRGHIYLERKDR